jgi:hypothetical protein
MIHNVIFRVFCPAIITAFLLGYVRWLIRRDAPIWALVLSVVALPIALVRSFAWVRIQGWHGLMHDSIVYRIYESGVPPENPLMAMEPLRYAYGEHFLIAILMRVIPLAPSVWFALLDVIGVALLASLIDRVARVVSEDKAVRGFAVLMALLGTSPFFWGPTLKIADILDLDPEPRLNPITKFLTPQNNQVGLVCSGLVLLGLVNLFGSGGTVKPVRSLAMVFVGLVAAGLLYPFSWMASQAMAGAVAVAFLLVPRAEGAGSGAGVRVRGALLLLVLALSAGIVVPYVLSLTAGKSGKSEIGIVSDPAVLIRGIKNVVVLLVLPAVVGLATRRALAAQVCARPGPFAVLAIWAAVGFALFLGIHAPMLTQYKFAMTGLLGLGVLLAPGLASLHHERRLWPLALAVPLPMIFGMVLAVNDLIVKFPVADRLIERGIALRNLDPDQAALDAWIVGDTPRDAVFLDDRLILTNTARRSMYLGLVDEARVAAAEPGYADHDGWSMPPWLFLTEVAGVEGAEYRRREALVQGVYLSGGKPIDGAALAEAAGRLHGRPLYILARDSSLAGRLRGLAELREAFQNPAGTIFRVQKPAPEE